MRNKFKIKKSIDFLDSLSIKKERQIEIEKFTENLLRKELNVTNIIKKVWDNQSFSDKEVIWLIFKLGIVHNMRDTAIFQKEFLKKILPKVKGMMG